MELVPEEVLATQSAAFDALRARLTGRYDLALVDETEAGNCLKYYLLLTEERTA